MDRVKGIACCGLARAGCRADGCAAIDEGIIDRVMHGKRRRD